MDLDLNRDSQTPFPTPPLSSIYPHPHISIHRLIHTLIHPFIHIDIRHHHKIYSNPYPPPKPHPQRYPPLHPFSHPKRYWNPQSTFLSPSVSSCSTFSQGLWVGVRSDNLDPGKGNQLEAGRTRQYTSSMQPNIQRLVFYTTAFQSFSFDWSAPLANDHSGPAWAAVPC